MVCKAACDDRDPALTAVLALAVGGLNLAAAADRPEDRDDIFTAARDAVSHLLDRIDRDR